MTLGFVQLARVHEVDELGLRRNVEAAGIDDLRQQGFALFAVDLGLQLVQPVADALAHGQNLFLLRLHLGWRTHDHHVAHGQADLAEVALDLVQQRDPRNALCGDLVHRVGDGGDLHQRHAAHEDDQERENSEPEAEPGGKFHVIEVQEGVLRMLG